MGKRIIGVDASKLADDQKTGVEKAVYSLIIGMKNLPNINALFILYTNKELPKEVLGENFVEKKIPIKRLWHKFRLPLALLRDKPEIFFEPSNSLPNFAPIKSALFIHDLAVKHFPNAYSAKEKFFQNRTLDSASEAKLLIFNSRATKKDFESFYPENSAQKIIIPLACDPGFFDVPSFTNRMKDPYFLFVGRLEERKNIINIVKAFNLYKDHSQDTTKLLLVGKPGHNYSNIEKEIQNSQYRKDIISKGFMSGEELKALYTGAQAFIFPSLYEGFGIPVLEAFATKTPVITSSVPAIKEVAADAAIYVNPEKPEEIFKAIIDLSANSKNRDELIKKGFERAKAFSWQESAKLLYNALIKL